MDNWIWVLVALTILVIIVVLVHSAWNTMLSYQRITTWTPPNPQLKVLDFGSGPGFLTAALKYSYPNLTGLDVVDIGIVHRPHLYDGKKIPFNDKTFDITTCNYVLHHTDNQDELLDELKRVTKKYLLIHEDTPSDEKEWQHAQHHINGDDPNGKFHGKDEWKEIFARHQLKLIHDEPIPWWNGAFNNRINKHFYVLDCS